MKYCPQCNKSFDDSVEKCPDCDVLLSEKTDETVSENITVSEVNNSENNVSVSADTADSVENKEVTASFDEENGSKKKIVIIAVVVAILVVAGIFAVKAVFGGDKNEPDSTSSYESTSNESVSTENTENSTSDNAENENTTDMNNTENESESESESETSVVPSTDKTEETTSSKSDSQISQPTSVGDYDILRSGTFYVKGSMVDATGIDTPMEWARTPESFYAVSDFEGAQMGMLIKGKEMYMIYHEKKSYLKMSEEIMKFANLDVSEFTEAADSQFNFSTWQTLDKADKTTSAVHKGHNCTVYHFTSDTGSEKRIFVDGNKLVRIANFSSSGEFLSAMDIDSVSAELPAGTYAPPSDYKAYEGITGIVSFMLLFKDVM